MHWKGVGLLWDDYLPLLYLRALVESSMLNGRWDNPRAAKEFRDEFPTLFPSFMSGLQGTGKYTRGVLILMWLSLLEFILTCKKGTTTAQ